MTDLHIVSDRRPRVEGLRPEVRALAQAYDLDAGWLRRVLGGRPPAALTVIEVRATLGVNEPQVLA